MVAVVKFCACLFLFSTWQKDDVESQTSSPKIETVYTNSKTPTTYCGIYCVYAASQALGRDVKLQAMVSEEYLSGVHGSTVDDLTRLANSVDLTTSWKTSLSIDDLEFAQNPMILHVRSPSVVSYTHWLLFLGFDSDGYAKVFDPPDNGRITKADLLAIWDGSALAVSGPKNRSLPVLPISLKRVFAVLLMIAIVGTLGQRIAGIALLVASVSVGAAMLAIIPEGFLWNSSSIRSVSSVHFQDPLEEIDRERLKVMLDNAELVLVDARPEDMYKQYHIPSAINVPIGISEIQLRSRIAELESVVKGKQMVVYCQSDKCGWADAVGNLLGKRMGRVASVYREGVNGWRQN